MNSSSYNNINSFLVKLKIPKNTFENLKHRIKEGNRINDSPILNHVILKNPLTYKFLLLFDNLLK